MSKETIINLGRHRAECKIRAHSQREEIESDFINWRSPAVIAKSYKLSNRASVYRHAHAYGLFFKRQRNVRAALEKIIERAGEVEVNAAAVIYRQLRRLPPVEGWNNFRLADHAGVNDDKTALWVQITAN